jgi:hypothetical protein
VLASGTICPPTRADCPLNGLLIGDPFDHLQLGQLEMVMLSSQFARSVRRR